MVSAKLSNKKGRSSKSAYDEKDNPKEAHWPPAREEATVPTAAAAAATQSRQLSAASPSSRKRGNLNNSPICKTKGRIQ
jgi:hypothetical protein